MPEGPPSSAASDAGPLLQLLQQAHAAVLMWELDGRITFCNRGAERLYGHRALEVVGQRRTELGATTFPTGFDALQEVLRTQGHWEGRVTCRAVDGAGTTVDVCLTALAGADGRTRVLELGRDVSAEVDRDRRLREEAERLGFALEAAETGTFLWSLAADRAIWTTHHERLWGLQPGTFDGTYDAYARHVHPDDLPAVNRQLGQSRKDRVPYSVEFRVNGADGVARWVLGRGRFEYDETGEPLAMHGIVMDITERKRAEQVLRESETALRALSARLRKVREEESTRIARELHDELGQALTAFKIDLLWLDKRLAKGNADIAAMRERLQQVVSHVDATVQSVRRISSDLRPGILDDLGLAAAVEWKARDFAERTGIACVARVPADDLAIEPDLATAVYRILLEALTNVVRHASASQVTIDLDVQDGVLGLDVRDDGVGVDLERLASAPSIGLLGMKERAAAFGGDVRWLTHEPTGTHVRVRIQLGGGPADRELADRELEPEDWRLRTGD